MDNKKRIFEALAKIILFFPPLGYISSGWKSIEESPDVPTMAVGYDRLFYNKEFVAQLTDEELGGVLLHEIFHCVFLHPTEITKSQEQGKRINLWTVALEIVVNATVLEMLDQYQIRTFKLPGQPYSALSNDPTPKGEIYHYDPIGKESTAIEIYERLVQKYPSSDIKAPIILDIIAAEKGAGLEAIEKSIATIIKLKQNKGDIPMGLSRHLKRLIERRIPFEKIINGFVGAIVAGMDDIRWEYPDWRHPMSSEIILPGCVSEKPDNIVVAVDTSGSISQKQLERFAGGIASLVQYIGDVTVYTTDSEVHEKISVKSAADIIRLIKFRGGGGTDFNDMFQKVKRCSAMIFFTDGYATYPQKPPMYPVLWVLTQNNETPPFGKVVYVLDE